VYHQNALTLPMTSMADGRFSASWKIRLIIAASSVTSGYSQSFQSHLPSLESVGYAPNAVDHAVMMSLGVYLLGSIILGAFTFYSLRGNGRAARSGRIFKALFYQDPTLAGPQEGLAADLMRIEDLSRDVIENLRDRMQFRGDDVISTDSLPHHYSEDWKRWIGPAHQDAEVANLLDLIFSNWREMLPPPSIRNAA